MSYDVNSTGVLVFDPTPTVQQPYATLALQSPIAPKLPGFYIQQISAGAAGGPVSNVKIKRPDGTWATVFQVDGVHIYSGGVWYVL